MLILSLLSFSLVWPSSNNIFCSCYDLWETLLTMLDSRYTPLLLIFILPALHDELWTNGRTDCALLLLLSSKTGRTNLVRVDSKEVLVENSSADSMHLDSRIINAAWYGVMLTHYLLGIPYTLSCPIPDHSITWWTFYSHYLSVEKHYEYTTKFWFNEVCSGTRLYEELANVSQPETLLWFFLTLMDMMFDLFVDQR